MESNFNSDNFERLLRESSDQYRMYPSETVWKSIYKALHTRRKWFGIGFLLLLLSAGFVTTIMMTNSAPSNTQQAALINPVNSPVAEKAPDQQSKNSLPVLYNETKFIIEPAQDPLNPVTGAAAVTYNNPVLIPFLSGQVSLMSLDEKSQPKDVTGNTVANTTAGTATLQPSGLEVSMPANIFLSDEATDQDLFYMPKAKAIKSTSVKNKLPDYPLSIESVINAYVRRSKRLSFQFYFTPTISYRKLSENKSYLNSVAYNPSNIALYYDINNVVTHKPDMGLELGVAARYGISKRLKLRAGLQFNTSRYDIKAFRSASEVTTIALNTGTVIPDSLNTISSYRNFNGYKSDWLHNFYFQVSAPIGAELMLAGDDRIKFGVAGTIQPTYVLGDRVYLISTNYKNYAEVPSLIRRWNMNTSFEAFVGYSTGRMNWQVGPQVRYQLLSSFVKEYPVKENLFDFGLKIGVSVNK